MSGVQMWRMRASLVPGLDLIQVFQLFEAVLVDSPDRFRQIPVYLGTADVEIHIIIMDDPRKHWVLRKVVMGSVSNYVNKIHILHISYFSVRPHVYNIA